MVPELEAGLPNEIVRRVEEGAEEIADRGAVWTYLTTDQPFERWKREFARRLPFAIAAYWRMKMPERIFDVSLTYPWLPDPASETPSSSPPSDR